MYGFPEKNPPNEAEPNVVMESHEHHALLVLRRIQHFGIFHRDSGARFGQSFSRFSAISSCLHFRQFRRNLPPAFDGACVCACASYPVGHTASITGDEQAT